MKHEGEQLKRQARDTLKQRLGLSQRAGKLISGEEAVLAGVRKGNAVLVLCAADTSDRTQKRLKEKCRFYHVPCWCYGSREFLGTAIGKGERVVIAITDPGLAALVEDELKLRGGEVNEKSSRVRIRQTDEHEQQRDPDDP